MNRLDLLMDLVRTRRSIRRFRGDPVDGDLVLRLIEAASWAPSAGNRQDSFFSIVTSPSVKRAMSEAIGQRWDAIIAGNRDSGLIEEVERYAAHFRSFGEAPVVIAVSARCPESVQRHLLGDDASATSGGAVSAAMAAQNLMLAAHAAGLGSCCLTGALAARRELREILELGRKRDIVCLIALGWPAESPSPPPRRPVSEIARFWP